MKKGLILIIGIIFFASTAEARGGGAAAAAAALRQEAKVVHFAPEVINASVPPQVLRAADRFVAERYTAISKGWPWVPSRIGFIKTYQQVIHGKAQIERLVRITLYWDGYYNIDIEPWPTDVARSPDGDWTQWLKK